jgi:hypothetical protein
MTFLRRGARAHSKINNTHICWWTTGKENYTDVKVKYDRLSCSTSITVLIGCCGSEEERWSYAVFAQILVKLSSYNIQPHISNITYAALAMLQVSGKQVFLLLLSLVVHWHSYLKVVYTSQVLLFLRVYHLIIQNNNQHISPWKGSFQDLDSF